MRAYTNRKLLTLFTLLALLAMGLVGAPALVHADDEPPAVPPAVPVPDDVPDEVPDEEPDEVPDEEPTPAPEDSNDDDSLDRAATEKVDEPEPGSLAALTKAWWEGDDAEARGQAAVQLLVSGQGAPAVAAALAKSRTFSADLPKGKVHMWKRPGTDGEHTCFLAIPESYDIAKPMPLLLWMHGGVARPADGGGASGLRLWAEKANEEGFLLLCPSARTGTEWWTPAGVDLVRGALADVRRRYNVDPARIAAGGFSDGASGCFHLLAHAPDPFCCFFALMGQPLVSRLFGGPTAAANLSSRPIWAVHGGQDRLYPTSRLQPLMEEMKAAGMKLTWQDLPDTRHDFQALPSLWDEMHAFWKANPREDLPKSVDWQTAAPDVTGRNAWVEILDVGTATSSAANSTAAGEATAKDVPALTTLSIPAPNPRPRLGIRLDTTFQGPGLKIEEVEDDTPAAEADFRADDIVVSVDGEAIAGPQEIAKLRDALTRMEEAGEDGVFVIKRGDEEIEAKARPKVLKKDLAGPELKGPGQGGPHGRVTATVEAGNNIKLLTNNVRRIRLHLSPELLDLTQPITVYVNGVQRFEGVVPANLAYLLSEAWRDAGIARYYAPLVLTID